MELNNFDNISSQLEPLVKEGKNLIYIGRFCPMHFGHQAMIGGVIQAAPANHLILVGSCNQPISYRNLFDFKDRVEIIRRVFRNVSIAGLPDFKGDNDSWFHNLDCMLKISGCDIGDAVFVGGCEEDITWFKVADRQTFVVNRFAGTTMNISGTEIRDHLITGNLKKLDEHLDQRVSHFVMDKFVEQWKKLKQQ